MTPVELSRTVLRAVRRAVDGGELSVTVPGRAVVAPPGPGGCGDYATNIALQLARPAGRPADKVAEILRAHLLDAPAITDVVVTGPGFLNISLRDSGSAALVEEILRRGRRYGWVEDGFTGEIVQLHAPHEVRAVVVMDAVSRLLRSQGALVRSTCEARPEPEWTDLLDAPVDAFGTPAPLNITLRPVPAPTDPTPLGRDAARWALLYPAAHDRPRITDEHLVQREGNPLFRVRYAHARTRALSRNAADLGFTSDPAALAGLAEHTAPGVPGVHTAPGVPGVPTAPTAPAAPADTRHSLTPLLADHPRVLAQAAADRAPDRLARHLVTVADAVLTLLPGVLPRGDEKPSAAHRARLALAEAAGTVLAGGLSLLGIDAPDHI
ncbi:arginyl-tRNA synthetase [Streptomyces sp. TLI_55]|uniref:ArgS-related anticodon-binding protein NrtL n=1 Tax=Streptomyces sp. TLI_55 TaxID=1938861 RepID=UPI000BD9E72C|nr:DALR anticodon-binding domain-containing protein [Streptomyces sp. TLI_55]SNX64039.1 arginyl-tRNA synthetase [Streptomyces sp. TLI_55]